MLSDLEKNMIGPSTLNISRSITKVIGGKKVEADTKKKTVKNAERSTRYQQKAQNYVDDIVVVDLHDDNDEVVSDQQMTLLRPLKEFFRKEENMQKMIQILNGESKISLRIIDWFITNYSKENNTYYNLNDYRKEKIHKTNDFDNVFFVHNEYRKQLKSFYKKKFDPFCRNNKFSLQYKPNMFIETTIGQLNFFKWGILNHVLDYINDHLNEIETHMNQNIKSGNSKKKEVKDIGEIKDMGEKEVKKTQKREKRREISPSIVSKSVMKYSVPFTFRFN
jgi:hypothetical protein